MREKISTIWSRFVRNRRPQGNGCIPVSDGLLLQLVLLISHLVSSPSLYYFSCLKVVVKIIKILEDSETSHISLRCSGTVI